MPFTYDPIPMLIQFNPSPCSSRTDHIHILLPLITFMVENPAFVGGPTPYYYSPTGHIGPVNFQELSAVNCLSQRHARVWPGAALVSHTMEADLQLVRAFSFGHLKYG